MKTKEIRHINPTPSATGEANRFYRCASRCPLEVLEPRLMLSAGDLETSFGSKGLEIYNTLGPAVTMALLPDGNIVVATEHKVARFTASGGLDRSFGTHGIVNMNFNILDMKLTADGHIVLVGDIPPASSSTNPPQGYVSMLTPNGAADGTFNGVHLHLPELSRLVPATTLGTRTSFSSVAVESNGTVLVGGLVNRGPNPDSNTPPTENLDDADIMAFNPNGSLDASFGSGGEMTTTDGTWFGGPTILILRGGDLELVGDLYPALEATVPYEDTITSSGALVSSADLPAGAYSGAGPSLVRHDGTVVVAVGSDMFPDGKLDLNGIAAPFAFETTTLNSAFGVATAFSNASAAAAAQNNQVVLAAEGNSGIVIARVNADGTPDTGFGFGGTSQITLNPYNDGWIHTQSVAALAVASDGDIIAAGNFGGHLLLLKVQGGLNPLSRAVPTAAYDYDSVLPASETTPQQLFVEVTYTTASGIEPSSLNSNEVRITGPNGYSAVGTFFEAESNTTIPLIAAYTFPYPASIAAADGIYNVYMIGGQVSDVKGRTVPAGKIGRFAFSITPTPTPSPSASSTFNMAPISPYEPTAGQQYMTFSMYLSSPDGIDLSSLGNKNFSVTSDDYENTFLVTFVGDAVSDGGDIVVATYRVAAPDGVAWNEPAVEDDGVVYPNSGNYTINLGIAPKDTAGNTPYFDQMDDTTLGNFTVLPRSTPPTATLVSIQAAASAYTPAIFVVRFTPGSGAAGMDSTSLDAQAVGVQSLDSSWNNFPPDEGGPWAQAQSTTVGRGGVTTVTYYAYGVGSSDSYVIRIPGAQSASYPPYMTLPEYGPLDSNGTAVPGGIIGTINASHSGPPTDSLLTSTSAVDSRGNITFQVEYDAFATLDLQEVDNLEYLVSGPHGLSVWAQPVKTTASADGDSCVVTYVFHASTRITPPPGRYYITLVKTGVISLDNQPVPTGPLGWVTVGAEP